MRKDNFSFFFFLIVYFIDDQFVITFGLKLYISDKCFQVVQSVVKIESYTRYFI